MWPLQPYRGTADPAQSNNDTTLCAAVGDAYIFRGGREGLYATTQEVRLTLEGANYTTGQGEEVPCL